MGELSRIDKIKIWFSQLFCRHEWRAMKYLDGDYAALIYCIKCGKPKMAYYYSDIDVDEILNPK